MCPDMTVGGQACSSRSCAATCGKALASKAAIVKCCSIIITAGQDIQRIHYLCP